MEEIYTVASKSVLLFPYSSLGHIKKKSQKLNKGPNIYHKIEPLETKIPKFVEAGS